VGNDTGIDAGVVLGVSGKLRTIFDEEGTFLAFPLSPQAYEQDELQGLARGETAEDLRRAPEFSRLVNIIPDGPRWPPSDPRFLWTVYEEVLYRTLLAQPSRTPEEEAAFTRAAALLHGVGEDGDVVDSEAMRTYRQLRDAFLVTWEEYRNQEGKAALADDEAKRRWEEVDGPALKAQVDDLRRRWELEGRKDEIEEAQRVERWLGDRSPAATFGRWRAAFDPSLPGMFVKDDAAGGPFVPTTYRPSDALEHPWYSISLSKDDLAKLATEAPEDLRERLGEASTSTIESLSFEYSSVGLLRPWFSSDAFASRAWKFSDGTRFLSDGGDPPSGECPAYVAGLVLARNITATLVSEAVEDDGTLPGPRIGFAHLVRIASTPATVAVAPGGVIVGATGSTPGEATVRDHRSSPSPSGGTVPVMLGRLEAMSFSRVRLPLVVPPSPVLTAPPPVPTDPVAPPPERVAATPEGSVYVLALICRKVPKSPDPDRGLTW
jgi:hypothetical protein